MRIAMVSEHASPLAVLGGVDAGGQNVFVAALSREVARRGHEVVVYTRRDDPAPPRQVELCPGVTVEHVDAGPAAELPKDELLPHMPAFARVLEAAWREWRPDVVHAHFWMSGHAALLAAEPLDIPVVQTFHALGVVKRRHQGGADTSAPERLEIERSIVSRAARVLPTCSDEVFELMRMGADNTRLTVVPCGVDLELFSPDGPTEERDDRRRRLLYVGRLVQRKGIGNVISALPRLPEVELVIAGGPPRERLDGDPEAQRLRRLAAAHGIADRVDLRGRVERPDLPALIRSADAVVTVPWYEPFGIVPLEAMACGVPVIATAVGGMIDSVVDGRTGVHVPPRDPDRLAEAIGTLLAHPAECRRYGAAGAKRARRLYDWRRIAAQACDVYAEVGQAGLRQAGDGQAAGSGARLDQLDAALATLRGCAEEIDGWGEWLGGRLYEGGRLLAAGNGGSASQAAHLTSELVGRYRDDRPPFSAIALCAESAAVTAIGNDYGIEEVFARQVLAHGRPGDVLVALSTSGRSANVLAAVEAAQAAGMVTWALSGRPGNPLALACDEALCVDSPHTATIQEIHLISIHLVCAAFDEALATGALGLTATGVRA
jgi:glycosyltransferase involved in cell wall biosynthesis/phosphoheptose isomerase